MKRLSGQGEGVCRASADEVAKLLLAVDEYPRWSGDLVRAVAVTDRDAAGRPQTVEATLRVEIGPVPLDLELKLAIGSDSPGVVTLTRLPNDPGDRETFEAVWHLSGKRGSQTAIQLSIGGQLDVPRLVPIGNLGNRLAQQFVDAAAAAGDRPLSGPLSRDPAGSRPAGGRRSR